MKFSKIVAIFLVSVMIISGMSTVVNAGIFTRSELTKEVEDEGTMRQLKFALINKKMFVIDVNKLTDIASKFKGYFPINLDDFGEEFKEDGLKVRFKGKIHFPSIITVRVLPVFLRGYIPIKLTSIEKIVEEPRLEFDISIDNTFLTEEPIQVEATLENIGDIPVIVDEMDPVVATLDLIITTPDNQKIHYIGPTERRLPERIKLEPKQKIVYNFEDITVEDLFGVESDKPYNFVTGDYNIVGEYITKIEGATSSDVKEEPVVYKSGEYEFEITDEIQEKVTLTLETDPKEVPCEVFTLSPEPLERLPILDGKIHAVYKKDTEVKIKSDASYKDYIFHKFTEDAKGEAPEITITMNTDKVVIAHYKKDEPDPLPPIACFSFEPEEPVAVETEIAFDSSCSTDPDDNILKFLWDFGDGASSEKSNPTHLYEKPGEYTVTLVVTDSDGLRDECSQTIKVIDDDPTETGIIFGTIREESEVEVKEKKPIADAKIEVFNTGRTKGEHYSTTSNEDGEYKLEVKIGEYKVIAGKKGYKPEIKTLLVESDTKNELNFVLDKIGADLEFDISIKEPILSEKNPLSITASITNNEQSSIEVSEIGIDYKTLILQIKTPDGKVLVTKPGKTILVIPPKVEIKGGETYSKVIDDLTIDDFVILQKTVEESSESYDFTPGEYVIKGIYISWGPRDGRWHGRLVSKEKTFLYSEIDG